MEQNIVPIGNSAGVIIPAKLRSQIDLKPGSKVFLQIGPDGKSLIISKIGQIKKTSSVTPEFLDILAGVNRRYGSVLASLANK